MAAIDVVSEGIANNNDPLIGKRKRVTEDTEEDSILVNGTNGIDLQQALESFQNLLNDLLQVLQDFDVSASVLNAEIQSSSSIERTPKRAKLSSTTKTSTISSLVKAKAYTNVDSFYQDVRSAVQAVKNNAQTTDLSETATKLEEEVVSILTNEIENSSLPIPRSETGGFLLSGSEKEDGTLATEPNLVLSTPGFVYGASQAPKRLFSSFRLQSAAAHKTLNALALDKLPNNVTVTTTKIEPISEDQENVPKLKDLFQYTKPVKLDPPRNSINCARGNTITWNRSEDRKKSQRSKDRQTLHDQQLVTGQWLSYNFQPSTSRMPSAEARRRRRDRALSTGEANVDLTEQEKEAIRQSQQIYQHAKADSLYKSLYSSFSPDHDDSGAIVPKETKSLHWWIKYGAAKYLNSNGDTEISLADQMTLDKEETKAEHPAHDDSHFTNMLDDWIDPELLGGMPKEKDDEEKEIDEILSDVSDMLQMLSSYQRNRSLTLNHKQPGSSTQNKSMVELLGDPSTPSNSEYLLYDTLKESLVSLITSLPPYAVAKLNGEQLGELNISTKMLVHEPIIRGTITGLDQPSQPSTTRTQSSVPQRVSNTQAVATPTPTTAQTIVRPSASIYSKYRPMPSTPGYQNYTSQQPMTPRMSYGQQNPSATPGSMVNGTRPTINGYGSYGSQGSPQRPSSGSAPRPAMMGSAAGQTYSNYNANAVNLNAARSASPQNSSNFVSSQRPGWSAPNGTIGSMFTADEVSRLEERQKINLSTQGGHMRQDSGTPRPTSQAMSPKSNGTQGA